MTGLSETRACLILTFLFGVMDAIMTLAGIKQGYIEELNPLWIDLIRFVPMGFIGIKLLLTAACCYALWLARTENERLVFIASRSLFYVYGILVVYHVAFLLDHIILSR